jgi:hypothetical protein
VKRVDDGHGETAGPARVSRGNFAGDPESSQRGGSREPSIRFNRKRGANERRAGAAHGSNETHQSMTIRDFRAAFAIGHEIDASSERDDRRAALREVRRRILAGKRREFGLVEPHYRRAVRHEFPRELRTRRRTFDEDRIEQPGFVFFARRRQGRADRATAFRIERAEIDQEGIRAGNKSGDLLRRDRHRWHGTSRQQHICRILLRYRVRYAMHPRGALANPRQYVGGNIGKLNRCMHFRRLSGTAYSTVIPGRREAERLATE